MENTISPELKSISLSHLPSTSTPAHSQAQLQEDSATQEQIIEPQSLKSFDDHYTFKVPFQSIKEERGGLPEETKFLIPARGDLPEYDVILRPRVPRLTMSSSTNRHDVSRGQVIQDVIVQKPPPIPLTPSQKVMALSYRHSENKRSLVAVLYFALACGGKIIMGFGAALAIQAAYTPPEPQHSGITSGTVLAVVGALSVIIASLGFGSAVTRVYFRFGWTLKVISISAASLITIGDAISQYYFSSGARVRLIRLTFLPLAVGTSLLAISLPNFVAYTELHRGRIIVIPYSRRPLAALICLGLANGMMFGGWVSGEHANWPPAFNLVIMTAAIAVGYFGAAILWSDHVRRRACEYDLRLSIEEESGLELKNAVAEFNILQERELV
ncbi:hypothetical protein CROQUDRAFT_652080 [Cronartium quercuum f. sp. fusiforme G11]|uniref:Uncharacterized protein n=1 Tax=Cronartium quercuum f. sp. fusiforme G11 TaxID=708437 RepID=A0A9P6NWP8_9BASI|nr:hypothetical protein CROQUDRAFT_652080 [Cronartium quercuum f. sp. fusiforme G11]